MLAKISLSRPKKVIQYFSLVDFVSKGNDPFSETKESRMHFPSTLHEAAFNGDTPFFLNLDLSQVEIIRDPKGFTPLHYAAIMGHGDVVKLLRPHNLFKDPDGRIAFLLAARYGHASLIDMLININSNLIFTKNDNKDSALHLACIYGHIQIIQILLSQPYKEAIKKLILSVNKQGHNCLHLAFGRTPPFILRTLLSYVAKNRVEYRNKHRDIVWIQIQKMRLTVLDLAPSELDDKLFKAIYYSIAYQLHLQEIDLSFSQLTHASTRTLISLSRQSSLKKLNLSGNRLGSRTLVSSAVMQLAQALEDNHHLESLSLMACGLDDHDAYALGEMLQKNRILRELNIKKNPAITQNGWAVLSQFRQVMHDFKNKLQVIDLSNSRLTSSSGDLLVSFIERNPYLIELNLRTNPLGNRTLLPSAIQILAHALERNNHLERLILVACNLDDKDVYALGTMLRNNKTLRHLDLRKNPKISGASLRALLPILERVPHGLQVLYVDEQSDLTLVPALNDALVPILEEVIPQENIFIKPILELGQYLAKNFDVEEIDDETKEHLISLMHTNQPLKEQDALNLLFASIVELEEEYSELNSPLKSEEALLKAKAALEWLAQYETYAQLRNFNLLPETVDIPIQYKVNREQIFAATLQRKLSMYWVTVNCLETQLLEISHNEVAKTLKNLHLIGGLLALIPGVAASHHLTHGILGVLEKIHESLKELVESLHFVEFMAELPGIHSLFHHLAEKLTSLKSISQEQMLKNILHTFQDFDDCNEECLRIAKAFCHRYDLFDKFDSLEDITKLAEYTANMILDFWKIGFGPRAHHLEDYHTKTQEILDWLFFGSVLYYKDQKSPTLIFQGKDISVTDFYLMLGLEFSIQNDRKENRVLQCDLSIRDPEHDITVKTNSIILGCRKGSKQEALALKDYLKLLQEVRVAGDRPSSTVRFLLRNPEEKINIDSIEAFEFTYMTKSQRLIYLEEKVGRQEQLINQQKGSIDYLNKRNDMITNEKKALEETVKDQGITIDKQADEISDIKKLVSVLGKRIKSLERSSQAAGPTDSTQNNPMPNSALINQHGLHRAPRNSQNNNLTLEQEEHDQLKLRN
ncbi:MAG: ankyrin repeat domain-containing protein [Gammaproteobacteria bacterium]|nr:ankyrin repeat domain-containing protein [Gammaproteobacteria bacterium]